MIIPLHLVPDLSEPALNYSLGGQDLDPALRPQPMQEFSSPIAISPVSNHDLQCFQRLMARAGMEIEPTRMLFDRAYACERLAQGYIHGDAPLRDLALDIFQGYQQAGEWLGLSH